MGKLAISGGSKVRERPFVSHAIIEEEERKRVNDVLDSGMLSGFIANAGEHFLGGKQVKEFETLAEDYFGTKFAVAVNSATAGLHAALGALGVGPGDEVIVTPYTMSASATAIIMMNAVPVFADIEKETFCLDPQKVKEKITPKTKAIVIVHLFGHAANMDAIMKIAEEHKLSVVEDCAQSPGATYKQKLVGTIGDIGVFSLNQHKTITSGEGGFAITNDEKLGLRMQLIRNHGEAIVDNMEVEDINGIVGFNYRMTELEAAVSIGQFRRLDFLNDHRINLARYLTEKLSNFEGLILPQKSNVDKNVYFVYPIRFKEDVIGVNRNTFVNALKAEGIPFGAGYVRPIYLEPMYQRKTAYGVNGCPFTCGYYGGNADYSKGICPVCEKMHEEELMLTGVCKYPHTEEDINDVVKAFEKIFKNIDELKGLKK